MSDLLFIIRCHDYPELVLDTVDAVLCTSTTYPTVVISSDANTAIGTYVQERYPQVLCYTSKEHFGWGLGLYTLLVDTIKYLDSIGIEYRHIVSLDYDCVPLRVGADKYLLDTIYKGCGLYGMSYHKVKVWNSGHLHLDEMRKYYTGFTWTGNYALGALMMLSEELLSAMRSSGMMEGPLRDVRHTVRCTDDIWLSCVNESLGFKLHDISGANHIVWKHPRKISEALTHEWYWYHPTKQISSNRGSSYDLSQEIEQRNVLRDSRGKPPLVMSA